MMSARVSCDPSDSTVSEHDAIAAFNMTTMAPKEVVVVSHV